MRRVLFIGDSLTYGYDPRGFFGGRYSDTVRWTCRLADALKDEWEILENAFNAREIPATEKEISAVKEAVAGAGHLDLAAVMLGTNDYLNMYVPDIVEVTKRMKKFLEEVKKFPEIVEAGTRILLIAPPYIHTGGDDFYGKYDTTNGMFNKAYKTLAGHLGILFADAGKWNTQCAYDFIHLSEQGNIDFALRMEETLINISLKLADEAANKNTLIKEET